MRKRLISICTIAILLYGIYGCATTDEDTSTVKAESEEAENADTADEETAIAEDILAAETETVEEENMETESKEAADTDDESDTIYLKPCNTYQDILDNAYTVIANHGADIVVVDEIFETTGIWEAGMGRQPDEALAAIGYTLYDVDGNGIEELIIADTGEGVWENRILLMYSLLDDKPVLIMDGVVRSSWYLLNDSTFYHCGSSGAAYTTFATYRMAEDGISLEAIDFYYTSESGWFYNTTGEQHYAESERIEFENEVVPWEIEKACLAQVKELALTFFEDYVAEQDSEKESYIETEQVISDYLNMDSGEFQKKYDRDDLYQSGILYCGQEAWKTHIDYVEEFQQYRLEDITAIRFYKKQPIPIYLDMNIGDQTDQYEEEISLYYAPDYAVSIYSKSTGDGLSYIQEISFVKIESYLNRAPLNLYDFMERNYYQVLESLVDETWTSSPDGDKAVCVSNGGLPKYASQVYVWQGDDKPLTVFREEWELGLVGWIDNNHLVYYHRHMSPPVLAHLERSEIEKITEERKYDTDGVEYSIQGSDLIAIDYDGEQIYQWQIREKDGEIYIAEQD